MHPPAPRATSCPGRTPRPATSDPKVESELADTQTEIDLVTFSQWVDAYAGRAAAEARRDIQHANWVAPFPISSST
jgi:hypothetical protein